MLEWGRWLRRPWASFALVAACVPHVKPTRVIDGVKTTIVVDDSWPRKEEDCPEAKLLPSALVGYIGDYALANLCAKVECDPQRIEVDRKTSSLVIDFDQGFDLYCIMPRGTPEGLVVTLKYNGGGIE